MILRGLLRRWTRSRVAFPSTTPSSVIASAGNPLTVASDYRGLDLTPNLLDEILAELRWLYEDDGRMLFGDGRYVGCHEVHLGQFDKEYIVRVKDNVILSVDRIIPYPQERHRRRQAARRAARLV